MPGRATAAAFFVAVACLALIGCNRPTWSTPDGAYALLVGAVRKGDYKVAWDALSEASKRAIEERSKALAAASGGALEDDPQALFFGSGEQPQPAQKIEVVREEGEMAVISVTPDEGPPRDLRMVKESGGWKLDVSDLLKD